MNRNQHLSYCSVCKNRKYTLKHGFICGLTDKIADFEENCKDFELDREKKKEDLEKLIDRIKEKYPKENGGFQFLVCKPIKSDKLVVKTENIALKSSKDKKNLLLIMGCVLIYFFIQFIYELIYKEKNIAIVVIVIILLSLVLAAIYIIKNYSSNKIKLTINNSGITNSKNEYFRWNEILYIHFTQIQFEEFLHIYFYIGSEISINISFLEMNRHDLGLLIYTYMKKVKNN